MSNEKVIFAGNKSKDVYRFSEVDRDYAISLEYDTQVAFYSPAQMGLRIERNPDKFIDINFWVIETIPPDKKDISIFSPNILKYISNKNNSYQPSQNSNGKLMEGECNEICSEELFRKLSLHAELGRILCIGVLLEKNGKEWRKGVFGYDTDSQTFHLNEEKTLRGFWKLMEEEFNPYRDLIVGHNVMDFDLPFIYKRSRILGVKPTVQLSFIRYRSRHGST